MKDVLFLAAYTPRSQAYAQIMVGSGLSPSQVILYGKNNNRMLGQKKIQYKTDLKVLGKIITINFSESLEQTCLQGKWNTQMMYAVDINDSTIYDAIKVLEPKLVIFSAYGSQMIGSTLLGVAPFLHIHSGWLPDYRGSTIIYYSILKEGNCSASALLINEKLDAGKIIARKKYPMPLKGVNIDYVYDSIIRADLLVNVLKEYTKKGKFSFETICGDGEQYFIIHPILKNLAYKKVAKQ